MDRLESMLVLITAAEAGSLSAAGRRLAIPLATVSRKVSELESHLRTRLLVRTRRGLTLTDAGRSYVAACKRILEDVGEAERAASGEGYPAAHAQEQNRIVASALDPSAEISQFPRRQPGER